MTSLPRGEIHLWHLDLGGALPDGVRERLDEAEWGRALRFRFERDRARYVHAHCAMRQVLGGYIGVPGEKVRFEIDPRGKPALAAEFDLGFNLSHSGTFGLLAVGRGAEVGVDIEEIAPRNDLPRLARSVFSAEEVRALEQVAGDKTLAFLIGWTRKEAYLKALGIGLALEPATVHVDICEEVRRIPVPGATPGRCVDVATVLRDEQCVAALAVSGGWSRVMHHRWKM